MYQVRLQAKLREAELHAAWSAYLGELLRSILQNASYAYRTNYSKQRTEYGVYYSVEEEKNLNLTSCLLRTCSTNSTAKYCTTCIHRLMKMAGRWIRDPLQPQSGSERWRVYY
jgi:hypothetical protein